MILSDCFEYYIKLKSITLKNADEKYRYPFAYKREYYILYEVKFIKTKANIVNIYFYNNKK